jgi:hypothetical protein
MNSKTQWDKRCSKQNLQALWTCRPFLPLDILFIMLLLGNPRVLDMVADPLGESENGAVMRTAQGWVSRYHGRLNSSPYRGGAQISYVQSYQSRK